VKFRAHAPTNQPACLLFQGVLDEQFTQLQQLQDDSNQDFVREVVDLFFVDSSKLLDQLTREV
jgi:histidine-containing phosphotransfer protein